MKLNSSWRINLFFILIGLAHTVCAQHSWIYFKSKCATNDDYFSNPVCAEYINTLSEQGIEVIGTSKWLNAAYISSEQAEIASQFDFVSTIVEAKKWMVEEEKIAEDFSYGEGDVQIEMLNLHTYHQLGNTGKGVRMGVFDAGFFKVDSLEIFDSMRSNNQIYAERDFVTNDTLTYRNSVHGMIVLAIAGINYPDSMMGAAPGANFMLVRTEDARSEKHVEEYNWMRAMEWADSVGVDIIHSSLGYSRFDTLEGDYTYADMDGKSTIITLAAEMAASRGIFVTNSAGNQGARSWRYITAPCDGEHVLCIGAVDSFRVKASFSSFGPSADGRVKPEVMAMGRRTTVPNEFGTLVRSSGTSLSGPLVAGLVACLMEGNPTSSNQQIFDAVVQSSDRYTTPDSGYGYGIPDAMKADSLLKAWGSASSKVVNEIATKVYPNPVSNELRIQCEPASSYVIRNGIGKQVTEGRLPNWINFVNLSEISSGHYTVEVRSSASTFIEKIILIK